MRNRSYRASAAGVKKLNQAFEKYGQTQEFLGSLTNENSNRDEKNQITCSRATVSKFFNRKPISKELFILLCNELKLDWQDIAELESEVNRNSRNVPSMNRASVISTANIESTKTTLVEEQNNIQTCITFDTINAQVVITIPGDINSFLQNHEQQNIWLEAVKRSSGDKNARIVKIEPGSIKINFNVSPDGIKKLKEEPDKIILVARIISRNKGEELDFSDTDLSGVDLSGVDLSGINFSCADFSNANLRNANLANADLDCADLSGTDLSLANLRGTSLNDAIIEDKWLTVWKIVNQISIDIADLIGADLRGANLSSANLRGAYLRGAYLRGAYLRGANLSIANLRGANLIGAYLRGADLSTAYLIGANLSIANLSSAYLRGADLSSANLSSAYLRGADLSSAYLISANLSSANLSSANLSSANLSSANLSSANLSSAYLIGADLSSANLIGAKVENARFGYNSGITEDEKRQLKQRGAIFEDFPGDYVRSKIPTR
ncbi:MAG: pentapeptide repeat-containing protein [Sphaerospermopsis sp. SIO1G1]|nr:pentapeptide repeat-containing protein [Sphaerospermopsis sp. SIO1G1]